MSSVPVPYSAAVVDAASTTLPTTDPTNAINAAAAGKRQSTPRPVLRMTMPNATPKTTVIQGNTRLVIPDNRIQAIQKTMKVTRLATIALRIDCARMSLAPSSAVASGDLPSPCFLRSLSG